MHIFLWRECCFSIINVPCHLAESIEDRAGRESPRSCGNTRHSSSSQAKTRQPAPLFSTHLPPYTHHVLTAVSRSPPQSSRKTKISSPTPASGLRRWVPGFVRDTLMGDPTCPVWPGAANYTLEPSQLAAAACKAPSLPTSFPPSGRQLSGTRPARSTSAHVITLSFRTCHQFWPAVRRTPCGSSRLVLLHCTIRPVTDFLQQ